jgi:hypothetical protein
VTHGVVAGFALLGLALALATACSGSDTNLERKGGPLPDMSAGGAGGTAVPLCAALDVVRAKCQRCHGEPRQNGAPISFLTAADFQGQYFETQFKWWEVAADRVDTGAMPFVALNDPPTSLMPPVEPLTATEKATLLGWLKQGAKTEGGTDCP